MIFPDEYKFVGIKDKESRGDPIYFSTRYLISRDGPSLYAVKSKGQGFMRAVEELDLIASGTEIVFHLQKVDTRNRVRLIELADRICREQNASTVVFQGPDEHVTFVHEPDLSQILEIEVLDVSPPEPPWLIYSLQRLEGCGAFGDLAVKFKPTVLDLREFACDNVYYPCRASGLGRSLDSDKVVHEHPRIVGCEVSREIFLAGNSGNADKAHEFVNICPLKSMKPTGPFITRCCKSERRGPTEKNGHKGVVVHWGEGPWAIAEAVRCLIKELRPQL